MGRYFGNKVGNYDVPLIFFYPGDPSFKGVSNEVAQQADIMPTVLDLVGYKEPYIAYGNSVFRPKAAHFAVNYMSGIYQLIKGDYCLQFNGDKAIALFNYKKDSLLTKNILLTEVDSAAVMEQKLKAIIQGYEEALESNTLYIK
jgi:arylsulfatase A-like enzyme